MSQEAAFQPVAHPDSPTRNEWFVYILSTVADPLRTYGLKVRGLDRPAVLDPILDPNDQECLLQKANAPRCVGIGSERLPEASLLRLLVLFQQRLKARMVAEGVPDRVSSELRNRERAVDRHQVLEPLYRRIVLAYHDVDFSQCANVALS